MGIAQSIGRFPTMLNDAGSHELEKAAKILLAAGQRSALEIAVQADGVSASVKGVLARVLDQQKQRRLH
jgi:hypothetical protein